MISSAQREGLQRIGNGVSLVLGDDRGGDRRHCSGIVYYAVDMEQNEALELYRRTGAYLEGHFRLSSGLHSSGYLQSALVLQQPADAASLGLAIAGAGQRPEADGRAFAGTGRSHHRPRSGARPRRPRHLRGAVGRSVAEPAPRVFNLLPAIGCSSSRMCSRRASQRARQLTWHATPGQKWWVLPRSSIAAAARSTSACRATPSFISTCPPTIRRTAHCALRECRW